MQEALDQSGLPLMKRLLELAGDGNTGAMRQCLDRLMGKHRPSSVALPAPDSPNYVINALTEIHRALGAGEIASDEAARLVDLVGRTARVLAMKAVAEIDFADRLARVEQVLVALLKANTPAAAQQATSSDAAPVGGPAGTAEAATQTGAERSGATPAESAQPVHTREDPGVVDNNNGNTMSKACAGGDRRPTAGDHGTDRTMASITPPSPLAEAA
jgi:hypothetical protein